MKSNRQFYNKTKITSVSIIFATTRFIYFITNLGFKACLKHFFYSHFNENLLIFYCVCGREIFALPDGGQVCLDWFLNEAEKNYEENKNQIMKSNNCPHKIHEAFDTDKVASCRAQTGSACCDYAKKLEGTTNSNTSNKRNPLGENSANVEEHGGKTSQTSGRVEAGGHDQTFDVGSKPLLVVLPGLTGECEVTKNSRLQV